MPSPPRPNKPERLIGTTGLILAGQIMAVAAPLALLLGSPLMAFRLLILAIAAVVEVAYRLE